MKLTYAMQGLAVLFALVSLALAIHQAEQGRWYYASINIALVILNCVLFVVQANIRHNLYDIEAMKRMINAPAERRI